MGWGYPSHVTKSQRTRILTPLQAEQRAGPWADPQAPLAASLGVRNQHGAEGTAC